MTVNDDHHQDKSIITVDTNKLIGVENETIQKLVQNSIDKGSKNITVDLSKVEYISSLGVGILIHAYTSCTNKNIKFNITGVSQHVMNVFSQLKLTELFNIS